MLTILNVKLILSYIQNSQHQQLMDQYGDSAINLVALLGRLDLSETVIQAFINFIQ